MQKVGGKPLPRSCNSQLVGLRGSWRGIMLHSRGSLLPLRRLHGPQAVTTFSQLVRPPWARGMTWSKVSSGAERLWSQYWQAKPSRRNTLNRVKAGMRAEGMKSRSAMTLGRRMVKLGE